MEIKNFGVFQPLQNQNWNPTSRELANQQRALELLLTHIAQGNNILPYIPHVIENCFFPGAARPLRQVSYLVLKAATGMYDLPWEDISGTISTDLGTSSDPELQIYALRMLHLLPVTISLEILMAKEAELSYVVKGEKSPKQQYVFLDVLPEILVKIWCGLGAENLRGQDFIRELFRNIIEMILKEDNWLCLFGFKALKVLFEESETGRIRGLSQELEANGSNEELLKPLIVYVMSLINHNLEMVIHRFNALDIRFRIQGLYPLCKLLSLRPDLPNLHYTFENSTLVPMVQHLEKAVVWEASQCLLFLAPHHSTIWLMCNKLLAFSLYEKLPAASLLLVTAGLPKLPISQQLSISLKAIEFSKRIENTVDRLSVVLSCLSSIVTISLELIGSGENSAIYRLFSQSWFVEMWLSDCSTFREEVLDCLVETCLMHTQTNQVWLTMAFEVADVCCRVLDWEESCFTYAAGYYFMLLDKLCEMSKGTSFEERKVQLMEELVIRIEAGKSEDCSIPNQYARNLALLTLAKYWQPESSEALQNLVRMVRLRLFNTEMMGFLGPEMSVSSSLSVTFLLSSCAYIGVRFHEELSQSIQEILEEFIEILESSKGPEAIIELSYKIIGIVNRAKQEGQEHIDQFDLVLDQKKGISIVEDSFFQDSLHAALNIFSESGTKYETIVPEKPMQLLKIKQTASEMNWRCLDMQEITGLADPIRVWCNNVIYPS